jgi:diguanylate cyclase (GGDEF)-like protein
MSKLAEILSHFPIFENEKNIISHIEEFLRGEYLVGPPLVYSINDNLELVNLKKCRAVVGKSDRIKLYSTSTIESILVNRSDLKSLPCFSVKVEDLYYYYLNLGIKRNQFYFAFFTSLVEIPTDILKVLSNFSMSHMKIIEKLDELYKNLELVFVDDVTGLYNQRKLHKDLVILSEKFAKEKSPFCVLFLDIDYFKKVNDTFGHLVGTKLLEDVARDIKGLLRDSDISYRYGGDEFVIILVDTDASGGKIVGERILSLIKGRDYEADNKEGKKFLKLSVSIGIAEFPTDAVTAGEILTIADRMMYEAKESGRGLVFNTQDVFKSSLSKVIIPKTKL